MRAPSSILTAFALMTLVLGCCAPLYPTASERPAIVIRQLPDYPMPDHGSDFPGGLVAAFWRDGRLVRTTGANAVGKSYVEGVVTPQQCEEFFRFLSTATDHAPKVDGIPMHIATQSITIRSEGSTSEWTRILPDTESVWAQVESRLLSLPLQHSHTIDSKGIQSLR